MRITRINEKNKQHFLHLIPRSMWKITDMNGYFCLGILSEEEGSMYAAGSLIFRIAEINIDESIKAVSVLEWFFVEDSYRQKGYSTGLFDEWKRIMQESGVKKVFCYFSKNDMGLLKYLVEQQGFQFQKGGEEFYRIPFLDMYRVEGWRSKQMKKAFSLSEIGQGTFMKSIGQILRTGGKETEMIIPSLNSYDREMSFVTMEDNRISTMLLSQRISEFEIRVLGIWSLMPGKLKELFSLMQALVKNISENYSSFTQVEFLCNNHNMKNMVLYFSEKAEPYTLYQAELDEGTSEE